MVGYLRSVASVFVDQPQVLGMRTVSRRGSPRGSACRARRPGRGLLDDGDEDVDRDGNPDCVFTAFSDVVELPRRCCLIGRVPPASGFLERSDGGGRKREVVGDLTRVLPEPRGPWRMRAQKFGVTDGCRSRPRWSGANDAGRAIRRRRIDAMSIDVDLARVTKKAPLGALTAGKRRSHDRRSAPASGKAYRGHERRAACHPRCR